MLTCRLCGRRLGPAALRTVRTLRLCANDLAGTPAGSAAYRAYELELEHPRSPRLAGLLTRAAAETAVLNGVLMTTTATPRNYRAALRRAAALATEAAEWRCVARWLDTGRYSVLTAAPDTTLGVGCDPRPSLEVLALVNPQGEVVAEMEAA